MTVVGVVREYHPEDGWGVIDAPEVPGGCWVHFSVIDMTGYRALIPGQVVRFVPEPARQDGYAFRAVHAWPDEGEPPRRTAPASVAYRSELTLTADVPPGPTPPDR